LHMSELPTGEYYHIAAIEREQDGIEGQDNVGCERSGEVKFQFPGESGSELL
jgi:hypothetical protein